MGLVIENLNLREGLFEVVLISLGWAGQCLVSRLSYDRRNTGRSDDSRIRSTTGLQARTRYPLV